jgi:hypothetical protein
MEGDQLGCDMKQYAIDVRAVVLTVPSSSILTSFSRYLSRSGNGPYQRQVPSVASCTARVHLLRQT